jgi:glycosyltransferase involved in cell wall biosynthesis
MLKVCHLTSVHARYDTRIFLKECVSLSKENFDVSLIVADGKKNEMQSGVFIYDVGKPKNRLNRILFSTKKVFKKAISLDADIYHFHDSELLFYGFLLHLKGKKVIYDIHEDLPRQLLSKPYLNPIVSKAFAFVFEKIENYFASKFDFLLTATPFIRNRFAGINSSVIDINNYPMLGELFEPKKLKKKNQVCFIGGISEIRGIVSLVSAMGKVDGKLVLAGKFNTIEIEQQVTSLKGWKNVDYRGFISREEAKKIMAESKAGVVTFLPEPNHINSQPNKMFEYMSAGLPVICSNFELWKSIIEENKCGQCIDPSSPQLIANSIKSFFNDKSLQQYGDKARLLVVNRYNWRNEEIKLIETYKKVLKND